MRPRQNDYKLCQKGIILLEILVAFAIWSISLNVILQTAGASVRHQRITENRIVAVSHAANVLARLDIDIPLDGSNLEGTLDDYYSWRVEITQLNRRDTLAVDDSGLVLASVAITIEWLEGLQQKNYQIETKRIIRSGKIANAK